ncbi:class I glutamine amidotransferase-like protein [Phaeosphaeriaceae sp. PMI808]|nr:class I glutamine amidotransferase-like protein [Phaeosphaeriaceae sp. PMI808]
MGGPKIRICMLNADAPVPTVFAQRGATYGRMFHTLLANVSPNLEIQSSDFNVMLGEYPTSLEDFDAIMIPGSIHSAYDDLPWIHRLDEYIRNVYEHHPRIKIFGSCFGHQLVAQSLLKEYGVRIEADPKGWKVGVKEVVLNERLLREFRRHPDIDFHGNRVGGKMRLQFVHQDHVIVPSPGSLPGSWMTLGSTEHCAVPGLYEPGRVFTLQGHFEYDRFVNSEVIQYCFGTSWELEKLNKALEGTAGDDDSLMAAQMIVEFMLEDRTELKTNGGLLTPPMEV